MQNLRSTLLLAVLLIFSIGITPSLLRQDRLFQQMRSIRDDYRMGSRALARETAASASAEFPADIVARLSEAVLSIPSEPAGWLDGHLNHERPRPEIVDQLQRLRSLYSTLLAREPHEDSCAHNIAWIDAILGNLPQAVAEAGRAVQMEDADFIYRLSHGFLLESNGQSEDAALEYQKAIILNPKVLSSVFFSDLRLRNSSLAAKVISSAITELKSSPDVISSAKLAALYVGTARYADADPLLTAVVHTLPNLSGAWLSLAESKLGSGNLAEASLDARRANYLDPRDPLPLRLLGDVEQKQGHTGLAKDFWKRAQIGAEQAATPHSRRMAERYATIFPFKNDLFPSFWLSYVSPNPAMAFQPADVADTQAATLEGRSDRAMGQPATKDENAPTLNATVLKALQSEFPMPVALSPDESLVVLKTKLLNKFELDVVRRDNGKSVASLISDATQLSISWKPDSTAILYMVANNADRQFHIFLWNWRTGENRALNCPSTATAAPPVRWAPHKAEFLYLANGPAQGDLTLVRLQEGHETSAIIAPRVPADTDFQWSPDGEMVAAVQAEYPSDVAILHPDTREISQVKVVEAGRVRHMAWSRDGRSLLVTARGKDNEYFHLFSVDLARGSSVPCSLTVAGDIGSTMWLEESPTILFEERSNGQTVIAEGDCDKPRARPLGLGDGVALLRASTNHGHVVVAYTGLLAPTELKRIDIMTRAVSDVIKLNRSPQLGMPKPETVRVPTLDGYQIPAVLWKPGDARSLVLFVHGGPHLDEGIQWDAPTAALIAKGIAVLKVNYRGSSGFGAAFEKAGNLEQRVADLLATRQYAIAKEGIPPDAVLMVGQSYGAYLAACAADGRALWHAVVLIATAARFPCQGRADTMGLPVLAFHGANDPVADPALARAFLEERFGSDVFFHGRISWNLLRNEGHNMARMSSIAFIYSAIAELAAGNQR
jgi:tetratricopeptide (TPR) repeat protein/pimeloyl-ACP methyl ester carboxylesterase